MDLSNASGIGLSFINNILFIILNKEWSIHYSSGPSEVIYGNFLEKKVQLEEHVKLVEDCRWKSN